MTLSGTPSKEDDIFLNVSCSKTGLRAYLAHASRISLRQFQGQEPTMDAHNGCPGAQFFCALDGCIIIIIMSRQKKLSNLSATYCLEAARFRVAGGRLISTNSSWIFVGFADMCFISISAGMPKVPWFISKVGGFVDMYFFCFCFLFRGYLADNTFHDFVNVGHLMPSSDYSIPWYPYWPFVCPVGWLGSC